MWTVTNIRGVDLNLVTSRKKVGLVGLLQFEMGSPSRIFCFQPGICHINGPSAEVIRNEYIGIKDNAPIRAREH